MGVHLGVLAAECATEQFHAALQVHCGAIADEGPVPEAQWLAPPRGQDVLHLREVSGHSYALDPAMVLSANSDLMIALSRELSCKLVGAGGESVSGTFWLTAADCGRLRRLHFEVQATSSEPFNLGEPLGHENAIAINDQDGRGIMAALASLGFDPRALFAPHSDGRRLHWLGESFPGSGELGTRISEHLKAHERPDASKWTRNISVVPRDDGGFDIRATERPTQRGRLFRRPKRSR